MKYKENSLEAAAYQVLSEAVKKPLKVGDVIPFSQIPKDEIHFEFSRDKYPFTDYLEPTGGGGGMGAVGEIVPEKILKDWKASNKDVNADGFSKWILGYFLPKNKPLIELGKKMKAAYTAVWETKKSKESLDALNKLKAEEEKFAPVFALARPSEKYRMLINESVHKTFPPDVIGTSEYDYSFHAGEGLITSWLISYGNSESAAKSKLLKVLPKIKFEYVGNSMEMRYAQKAAIGYDW